MSTTPVTGAGMLFEANLGTIVMFIIQFVQTSPGVRLAEVEDPGSFNLNKGGRLL